MSTNNHLSPKGVRLLHKPPTPFSMKSQIPMLQSTNAETTMGTRIGNYLPMHQMVDLTTTILSFPKKKLLDSHSYSKLIDDDIKNKAIGIMFEKETNTRNSNQILENWRSKKRSLILGRGKSWKPKTLERYRSLVHKYIRLRNDFFSYLNYKLCTKKDHSLILIYQKHLNPNYSTKWIKNQYLN